jgi:hypothetical protein
MACSFLVDGAVRLVVHCLSFFCQLYFYCHVDVVGEGVLFK